MARLGAREGREPRPERGGASTGTRGTPVPARLLLLDLSCSPAARRFPGPEPRTQGAVLPVCLCEGPCRLCPRPGFLLSGASLPSPLPQPGPLSPPPSHLQRPGPQLPARLRPECLRRLQLPIPKYSLMTQLEDKSPDWLLQAKYRAGGTTCPRPRAPNPGLPSHVGPSSCVVERGPRKSEGVGAFCFLDRRHFQELMTGQP